MSSSYPLPPIVMGTQRWAGSPLTQHSSLLFPRMYHSTFWESLLPSVATVTCLNPDHSLHYHLGSCQFALCPICIFSIAAALKGPSASFSLPQDTSFLRRAQDEEVFILSLAQYSACWISVPTHLLPSTCSDFVVDFAWQHPSLSLVLAFLVSLSLLFVFFRMKSYASLQTHTPCVSQVHTYLSNNYPPILPHLSFAATWV